MNKHIYILAFSILFVSCSVNNEENSENISEKEVVVEKIIETEDETGFIHTVFFWMDSALTYDQRTEFEVGMENLLNIESIYHGYYGPPAMTPREVVDNSYDYAFVVHFRSKEEHDLYQQDPLHLQFITDYKTYWNKILIYDNLVNTPK